MPPKESRAQTRAKDRILEISNAHSKSNPRRTTPSIDVFRQLLTEASDPAKFEGPPRKRRRVGERDSIKDEPESKDLENTVNKIDHNKRENIIASDNDSDESDFTWEDVKVQEENASAHSENEVNDVQVEINPQTTPSKRQKRKGVTAADKQLAISIHKTHVLFLLFHVHVRNSWCNNPQVKSNLQSVLPAKVIRLLNPDPDLVQLRQSDLLHDGLKAAVEVWQEKFKVTSLGMWKARWANEGLTLDQLQDSVLFNSECLEKSDFIKASKTLQGSQDLGNQLFCALLRAVGVEARLVCSLQPLPWTLTQQKAMTPQKVKTPKPRIYATYENDHSTTSSTPIRRLGQSRTSSALINSSLHKSKTKKRIRKLEYPIFWVEVLNQAYQKWLPIDVTVTGTIDKPAKLEPPAVYDYNAMSYVIAFDEDQTARDVTRRYVKLYYAKTWKLRVETLEDGQKWFKRAMKSFQHGPEKSRDQIEDSELLRKEAQEGLPTNIEDFKDHHHYALERHLKRTEVIWPKKEIGKINTTKALTAKMESIYRRANVQIVQSADKWYRAGRDIKAREQPVKHVTSRNKSEDAEDAMTPLYMYSQTENYVPPPVIKGKVPKNLYGNIDLYIPSMVPLGGIHVRHSFAKKAAQIAGIDFAEAVTGFKFKGRHGTAIIQGIVVAEEYATTIEAIINGLQELTRQEEEDIKSLESLRMWRRFLLGLQIAQRIGLSVEDDAFQDELENAENKDEGRYETGGFVPDDAADMASAQPTAHLFSIDKEFVEKVELPAKSVERAMKIVPSETILSKRKALHDDEDEVYDPGQAVTIHSTTNSKHPSKEAPDHILALINPTETKSVDNYRRTASPINDNNLEKRGNTPEMVEQNVLPNDAAADISQDQQVEIQTDMDHLNEEIDHGGGFVVDKDEPDTKMSVMVNETKSPEHESSDDKQSLLSHDPDDDDADPDWLG